MMTVQRSFFDDEVKEDPAYLKNQLITYIGNKRSLLSFIESGIYHVKQKIGKDKITFLDLFSGTGVVSRMARKHSSVVHCNDMERYSEITNICYQSNENSIEKYDLIDELRRLELVIKNDQNPGFISELYAPQDDNNIKFGERVFYTRKNALFLDAFCRAVADTPEHLRPYAIAPILSQASMYANTSGVFKGFYKNKAGIGQFGGHSENALNRIKNSIKISHPIFSKNYCESFVYKLDANVLSRDIDMVDIVYMDPPYNQHPYGSNYFMLNLICDYIRPSELSSISGIPKNWNRSLYNKQKYAGPALFDAIDSVRAKFVLISYNSEGFIKHDHFLAELSEMGEVSVMDTRYNTFRGCRNLSDRDIYVTENLYLLDKR